jgi:hypothetical protein
MARIIGPDNEMIAFLGSPVMRSTPSVAPVLQAGSCWKNFRRVISIHLVTKIAFFDIS